MSSKSSRSSSLRYTPYTPSESPTTSSFIPRKSPSQRNKTTPPRPSNSFILFRSNFCKKYRLLCSNLNSNALSILAADSWKTITAEEKETWVKLAAEKRAKHKASYPDFEYQPKLSATEKKQRSKVHNEARCAAISNLISSGIQGESLREPVKAFDEQVTATISGSAASY